MQNSPEVRTNGSAPPESDAVGSGSAASLDAHLSIGHQGGEIEQAVIGAESAVAPIEQPTAEVDLPPAELDAVKDLDATQFAESAEATTQTPAVLETSKDTTQGFFPPNTL
jgi:hypothetical protein